MEKYYFTYEDIHRTAKDIADRVKASGFEPDVIVAIGSGGFIPARILRTFLGKPILAVGVAYYDADDKPSELPRKLQWIEEAEKKLAGRKILLVDEVDDSRTTLEYCIRELMRHNPAEIAVAVLHDKKKEKRGSLPPEVKRYIAGRTIEDRWVCYPWDALDIGEHLAAAAAGSSGAGTGRG
jgi:hypoxanthine phosphoribosyltransferase